MSGKIATAVGIAVIALWLLAQFASPFMSAGVNYDCDNLAPEMVALSEKNAAQSNGITLVGIVQKTTVTRTDTNVECRGKAKWSNGTEGSLTYKAYIEEKQWWLSYTPD